MPVLKTASHKLSATALFAAAVNPIASRYCLNRIYIDLTGFTSQPDKGVYQYVSQVKDHFYRMKASMHQGVLKLVMLFGFRDHRHAAAGLSLLHQTPAPVLALQPKCSQGNGKGREGL